LDQKMGTLLSLEYTFPLAALIELGAPIILAVLVARRWPGTWPLIGIGTLTFIGSQIVHLPLNWLLGQLGILPADKNQFIQIALVLGLSAGVCEETARAVSYGLLRQRARAWPAALALGAGHGGIESMIVGALVLLTYVNMQILRTTDLITAGIPANQLDLVRQQIAFYWSQPWHVPLAGAVERMSAITLHLALATLVLQAFTRRNVLYYLGAVGWHTAVNAVAVILLANKWDYWAIEGVLFVCALISGGIIWALRASPYDQTPAPPVEPPPLTLPPPTGEISPEQIERSKFEM
jgi:uncharacterized membrane protein YhfC